LLTRGGAKLSEQAGDQQKASHAGGVQEAARNGDQQAAKEASRDGGARDAVPHADQEPGGPGGPREAARDASQQPGRPGGPGEAGNGPAGERPRRPGKRLIALATAIVAVIIGGGVYALTRGGGQPAYGPPPGSVGVTLPGPFRVMSVTPASGTQQVDGSQPIEVAFSAPLSAGSGMPTITPHVAGHWQADGDSMIFTPDLPLSPSTQFTVTAHGGGSGVQSAGGKALAHPVTAQFTTAPYSVTRLAQLLSQLGYLPMSWQESVGMRTTSSPVATSSVAGEQVAAYDPPAGVFTMQAGYPASLAGLWDQGSYNVILQGAVMAFQSQHNMQLNGDLTSGLWNALFQAAISGQYNANGYSYAVANQVDPETLTIWHNGQVVLTSPANTGIPAAPTVDGTFPVYLRFLNTIMSGTNPDGSHYSDPVQFVSYFNGGDAVHYFPRGSYGFQQSLGCVELPYSQAQAAYPLLTYGSLVTVTG
jgi:hypothetical protein